METRLTLGPVMFSAFEVPEQVRFGGGQALAVHTLPGGGRVIDALGRDDADLVWSGVFSGADAGDRARLLDALRAEGAALTLSWDAFFYTVVIARLDLEYRHPWWIPYRIACTPVRDEAAAAVQALVSLADSVLGDVMAASGWCDVSGVVAALGADGATMPGSAAYAAALGSLGAAQAGVSAGIAAAEAGIGGNDLGGVIAASGSLAQMSAAQGFLGRAGMNLFGAGM
ncbi:MAG TPA: hypothetical protein VMI52_06275 [Acetobacteraceae bacterium]|nr:hypothetical protein [Acetobacteraceae bacterium]